MFDGTIAENTIYSPLDATVVIAHRLSTIQNANRILMLTEDAINEQGLMMHYLLQKGRMPNCIQCRLRCEFREGFMLSVIRSTTCLRI